MAHIYVFPDIIRYQDAVEIELSADEAVLDPEYELVMFTRNLPLLVMSICRSMLTDCLRLQPWPKFPEPKMRLTWEDGALEAATAEHTSRL